MSSDGPGITHGMATWLHWNDISNTQTDADQNWVVGKQRLQTLLEKNPHLRLKAAKLARGGMKDPWQIIWLIKPGYLGRQSRLRWQPHHFSKSSRG